MAKCGIDKYDKLPARVGIFDVDYLRYRLSEVEVALKHFHKLKKEIENELEMAYKQREANKNV